MKLFNAFVALFLLGLMFFISSGQLVQFKVRQYHVKQGIKQRIKEGLPEEELDLVKIPLEWEKSWSKDFKWIEGHEFRYKGEMYDVVRQEVHNNETWYYCIKDEKENELFAELEDLLEREMADEESDKSTTSSFNLVFLPPKKINTTALYICDNAVNFYTFTSITWAHSPPTQPPRQLG